ncbi:MFS transporter [Dyella flava]|uniref:MFS transporter n=1 Tax=Dyella flava TaxID=1920170 RepID=UPI00195D315D
MTLLALVFLFQGTSDLYSASMPEMAEYFGKGSFSIQLTITLFLVFYGLGQFVWVYFSERYSRKTIFLINIVLFALSSLMASQATSLPVLYAARALQGIAISALNLNAKAMPLEIFSAKDVKIFFSYFALLWGAGGTLAPWMGAYVQQAFGWRMNFVALAVYAAVCLIFAATSLPDARGTRDVRLGTLARDFLVVLGNGGFVSGVVAQACTLSLFLAYNYFMSFYLQDKLHYGPVQFGYFSFCTGISFVAGCLLFRYYVARRDLNKLSLACGAVALALAIVLSLLSVLKPDAIHVITLLVSLIIFCSGVMASENIGITMLYFTDKASVASCLHTALHFVVASILMYVLGLFSSHSLLSFSGFYVALILLFVATNQYCYRRRLMT